ncbi:MAG: hypothetical protein IKC69_06870 [Clostridia bacterium]|nr:hypothetical protein [Clostridia bacterium]
MKRTLSLLIAVLMLLSAAGCSTELKAPPAEEPLATTETSEAEQKPAATPATKETKPEIRYPNVTEPLTPERLAEIPIANSNMSIDELRQICLDYFKLQLSFSWTPDANYTYVIESSDRKVRLTTGSVYGGIPYVTVGTGNLYRWLETYDTETGIMNVSDYEKQPKHLGNQCSVGAWWGWGRVINSAHYTWTQSMVLKNGFIPVGPYTYDPELPSYLPKDNNPTKTICQANGHDVMYESYAKLQPADGLVCYGTAGHVRMVASAPNVVYDANGKIDGNRSTLKYHDQTSSWRTGSQSDGSLKEFQGGRSVEVSFQKLYSSSYLPFTFAEFLGTDPVEKSTASCTLTSSEVSVAELKAAKVNANYSISDTFVVIKNAETGEEVNRFVNRALRASLLEMDLENTVMEGALAPYTDGKHTVEISLQLSTGEKPTVYQGKLIP